jgi:hypothetical protein
MLKDNDVDESADFAETAVLDHTQHAFAAYPIALVYIHMAVGRKIFVKVHSHIHTMKAVEEDEEETQARSCFLILMCAHSSYFSEDWIQNQKSCEVDAWYLRLLGHAPSRREMPSRLHPNSPGRRKRLLPHPQAIHRYRPIYETRV